MAMLNKDDNAEATVLLSPPAQLTASPFFTFYFWVAVI